MTNRRKARKKAKPTDALATGTGTRAKRKAPLVGVVSVSVFVLALVVALVAGGLFWLRRPSRPTHIVLISIDTLRADHLGCYGYSKARTPEIDRLASESVVFDNAATATPLTLPAHSSLLTGLTPTHHGVVDNFGFRLDDTVTTLAETLHAQGFSTGGFVGSFVLDSRFGIAQGFDTYFDHFDKPSESGNPLSAHQRTADQVLAPALQWIDRQGTRPFFAFVHFFDAHTPYAPPEPFRSSFPDDDVGRYDGEIAFVDEQVGKLVRELDARGILGDTALVVVGDHGESLGDHGEATHGLFLYDATVRVPLLVKAPSVRPGRARAQVRTIDVMPTLLDLVGVKPSSALDGVSLRSILEDRTSDPGLEAYVESQYARLHFGWAPLRGIRTERYKFIDAPVPELYDLRNDPAEARNLAAGSPEVASRLARKIDEVSNKASVPHAGAPVDPVTAERLRALGYLTSTAAAPTSEAETNVGGERNLPDPKSKIDVFNAVGEASIANITGDTRRAASLLISVVARDPDVIEAYLMLGNLRLREHDYEQARIVFEDGLARARDNLELNYGLALAEKGLGHLERAEQGFRRVLELAPDDVRSTYQLAEVLLAERDLEAAETLVRARLERGPDASLSLLLADVQLSRGRSDEAHRTLLLAEKDDPENALVELSLGNLLLRDDDVEGAIRAYRRAVALDPKNAPAQNALGLALARKGEGAASRKAFETAAELDPHFAPAQNNLGIALAGAGESEKAEGAFRRAIDADPRYAEAYNNLGFLFLQRGEVKESAALFRRAIALAPDYAQARANLQEAERRAAAER